LQNSNHSTLNGGFKYRSFAGYDKFAFLAGLYVKQVFMKLFQTSNMEIVRSCQSLFGFELPSVLLTKRYDKFIDAVTNIS